MCDNLFSFAELKSRSKSKFETFLILLESIITLSVIALIVAFIFTSVIYKRDICWFIGVLLCVIMWGFAFWKHSTLVSGNKCVDEKDYKYLFFCVLFSGFTIRLTIAMLLLPKPDNDCATLYYCAQKWSAGDFIETKSIFQTAFYAFWHWLAGPSLRLNQIINAALGSLQIIIAYDLARRIFKRGSIAVAAAALTAFHPTFIYLTLSLYTELLFGVFLLLSFRAFIIVVERIEQKLYDKQTVIQSIKLAFCCLCLFYTRPNGLFVIILSLILLALSIRLSKIGILKVILPNLITIILIMFIVGLLNVKIVGHFYISSSEDSCWPLLFGSCVETKGIYSVSDKKLIRNQYYEMHPEMVGKYVHVHDLAPLIKKEFYRRWREETSQMIDLAILKYKSMWGEDDYWVSWFIAKNDKGSFVQNMDLIQRPAQTIKRIAAVCLACWLILLPGMKSTSRITVLLMLLFIIASVVNHLFVEWSPRYSYPLTVVLSVLAPGILLYCSDRKSLKKGNN